MKTNVAWLLLAVATFGLLAWRWQVASEPGSSLVWPRADPAIDDGGWWLNTSATDERVIARRSHAIAARASSPARTDDSAVDPSDDGAIRELLDRLRELASAPGFHERSWSTIEELADLVRLPARSSDADATRIVLATLADPAEHELVRSACLIAFGLARPAREVEPTALAWALGPSDELARAGWIALGLSATAPSAVAIELARFDGVLGETTFPATVRAVPSGAVRAAAIARALRAGGGELAAPDCLTLDELRHEIHARQIAVIACLGTSVTSAGAERRRLIEWMTAATPPDAWLRTAAAFCIAQGAQSDDELFATCEQAARASLASDGVAMLSMLVDATGRDDLGLEIAREVLEDDDLEPSRQAEAMLLLSRALDSPDRGVREEAEGFAVARALAGADGRGDGDPLARLLFVDRLGATERGVMLEVADALTQRDLNGDATRIALLSIAGLADRDQRERAGETLERAFLDPRADAQTRIVALRALVKQDSGRAAGFLRSAGIADADPEVRRTAIELLRVVEALR